MSSTDFERDGSHASTFVRVEGLKRLDHFAAAYGKPY